MESDLSEPYAGNKFIEGSVPGSKLAFSAPAGCYKNEGFVAIFGKITGIATETFFLSQNHNLATSSAPSPVAEQKKSESPPEHSGRDHKKLR